MRLHVLRLCLLPLLAIAAWAGESFSTTFTATSAGGQYWADKTAYVLAVWVEGPASTTRIATIYGTTGKGSNLTQWKAKGGSQNNGNLTVDGVMGATLNSSTQRTRTVTWNLTTPYKTGNTVLVPDGSYQIWLESVDEDTPPAGTASVTGANRFHFTFVRDGVSRSAVPISDGTGKFTSITYSCTGRIPTCSNPALTISTGDSTTFTVSNNAAVAPSGYQWRKGGTAIPGATTSTYTIASAVTGDAGSYTCVVSYPNTYLGLSTTPTMTSNALTLAVASGTIAVTGSTVTPASTTVNPGATVTLTNTPTPADATSPVYAWYSNTVNSTSGGTLITGQILGTYNPPTASAGTVWYYGRISNSGGNATSTSAVSVTVRAAPTISAQPVATTVAAGGTASFSVTAGDAGFPALAYQWQALPPAGAWTSISGATSASYSTTTLVNATQYRCRVTNAGDSGVTTISNAATLTVVQPPSITADTAPLNPSAVSGGTVTFSVAATIPAVPAGTLSYQWQYRASSAGVFANIGGATAASYAATAGINGGQYQCILRNTVSGVSATTVSRTTTIAIAAATPPLFTTQPASAAVMLGTSATFTVAVSGVPTPILQWSDSADGLAWTDIPGATATIYVTPVTTPGDVGVPRHYRCTAANGSGTAVSSTAIRTVTSAASGIAYINFTSSPAGGAYGPDRHVMAAWIQQGATFKVTIGNWSSQRRPSLVLWNSVKSGTDAVMGATQLSHRQIGNLTWRFDPALIADGTYTLWLESADDNPDVIGPAATTSVNGANRASLDFTIVGGSVVETTGAGGGFSAIRISAIFDPTAITIGTTGAVQDAGKVASCGSGGIFALLLAFTLMLALVRRRA